MYCKFCGKTIDDDAIFCNHCGKRLLFERNSVKQSQESTFKSEVQKGQLSTTSTRNLNPTNKSSTKLLYLLLGTITVIILIWLYFMLFANTKIADVTIDKITPELAKAVNKYDRLYNFQEGLARVKKNNKYGFIDKLGNEIISCKYDDAKDFEYGLSIVKSGDKTGCIDYQDRVVIPCKYDFINSFAKDSIASAQLNDKMGLINLQGKAVIPFEYEECGNFQEGLALIRKDGLYGFINKECEIVIPCQYEGTFGGMGFCEGLAGVEKNGYYGYIDKHGKVIIPFTEENTGMPFKYGLSTRLHFTNRRCDGIAFIDTNGELVSNYMNVQNIQEFRDGLSVVKDYRGFDGLINLRGEFVLPCEYSFIANGFDKKYVVVGMNDKFGYADKITGELIIPCDYDIEYDGWSFHEGLVPVKKNGKYGYINDQNQIIIPFIYDNANAFSQGLAVVERFGKYGYVDRYGNDTFK